MRNADNYARYAVAIAMGSELGMPKAQKISRESVVGPTPWDEAIREHEFWDRSIRAFIRFWEWLW